MKSTMILVFMVLFCTVILTQENIFAQTRNTEPIIAQQLVDQFVRTHPEVAALELATTSNGQCKTIAATAAEDVGEPCDSDELGPMQSGKPNVEEPTKDDPVFDITQALHDVDGHLIGAVGMDIKPDANQSRDAVVMHAQKLLKTLEAQIPSMARLLDRATP